MTAHEEAGYGAREIGFGRRPAMLVVDFQRAFTDPEFELGRFAGVHEALRETAQLLEIARAHGVPEECVGDGAEDAHRQNLKDTALRYADVVSATRVADYLRSAAG